MSRWLVVSVVLLAGCATTWRHAEHADPARLERDAEWCRTTAGEPSAPKGVAAAGTFVGLAALALMDIVVFVTTGVMLDMPVTEVEHVGTMTYEQCMQGLGYAAD